MSQALGSAVVAFIVFGVWPAAAGLGDAGISTDMVAAHNAVRGRLGLPKLVWSRELAEFAREWAQYLAVENDCRLVHRPRDGAYASPYGENLYWSGPIRYSDGTREVQAVDAVAVVDDWVGEARHYDYGANRCREGSVCGHYTQVVWRATERVGCARVICSDQGQIWVCNYDPAGNIVGRQPF